MSLGQWAGKRDAGAEGLDGLVAGVGDGGGGLEGDAGSAIAEGQVGRVVELERSGEVEACALMDYGLVAEMRLGEGRREVDGCAGWTGAIDGGNGDCFAVGGGANGDLVACGKSACAADADAGCAGGGAGYESRARVDWVPTRVTVTVSMPWPTLAMSRRILSPAEMLATEVTLRLVEPAGASAAESEPWCRACQRR